jgi:ferredoxin-NADP reductase
MSTFELGRPIGIRARGATLRPTGTRPTTTHPTGSQQTRARPMSARQAATRPGADPQTADRPAAHAGHRRKQARATWFAVAAALNAGLVAWSAGRGELGSRAEQWSLAAFCLAVAARHDGLVRGVFVLGRVVRSYRLHQLAYHLGQLHRALALAGMAWLAVAAALAVSFHPAIGLASAAVLAILIAVAYTARDRVRQVWHNRFESIHRLGGWAALGILAVIVPLQAAGSLPPGSGLAGLIRQPSVVLLTVLVLLVAHPWLGVRRLPAEFLAVTADVVVVALPGRRQPGEFIRVSRDGREWHSFAVATTGAEGDGRYCLVIRRAGDWTERLASDAEHGRAPARLWVRRMRGYGFMYHAQAYRRVLMVATGAGIGPVLPYLLDRTPVDFQCLWIGRSHHAAMGPVLVDRVLASGRVTLIDTAQGRPDVGACVASVARRFEAVFVVSNDAVRDSVARACEALGVPWYGPTFDS